MVAEPRWTYWCPAEGTHVFDPNELHVGIVSVDDTGMGHARHVAAVVPPMVVDHGTTQMEGFAIAIRDALAAGNWHAKDGLVAWLAAHGSSVPFPNPLLQACGGTDA